MDNIASKNKLDKYITLNNGVQMPIIGIGTDNPNVESIVNLAIGNSFLFFDTAYMYLSEKKVGNTIKQSIDSENCSREQFFIQSKTPHRSAGYSVTCREFDNSLNKLQLDYLDSYLIHLPQRDKENWQDLLLDTWLAMEKLYNDGKIRVIGVSNFLEHHLEFLIKNANIKPMVNQIEIHPQHPRLDLVDYCNKNNIIIQAWSPLGAGRSYFNTDIKNIANKYNTNITNLVLNWHFKRNIIPIVGFNNRQEFEEIKNFRNININEADYEKLFLLKEDFTGCHNDCELVNWIPTIPKQFRSVKIDDFVPNKSEIKLFGEIPFIKIVQERRDKTKYYLFNIPIAKTIRKSFILNKKSNWTKEDYISGKYKIERVFNDSNLFLECPVFDKKNGLLFCVAEYNNKIYKINPHNNKYEIIPTTEGVVGCIDIDSDGCLISAEGQGIFKYNFEENEKVFLTQIRPQYNETWTQAIVNYNDGKLDARNRLIIGTASPYNNNKLYSFDGKSVKVIQNNITCSNGIAWSLDNTRMYYTDSPTQKIALFNYDIATGNAYFVKDVIDIDGGTPDGMCIDIDDNLWVAEYDGMKISKWDTKTYEKIDEINFPVHCTSCCVGGDENNYLFVTTAQKNSKDSGLYKIKIR